MWQLCGYIQPTKMTNVIQKTLPYMPRGKNMAMSSSLIYNIDRLDGGGYLQNFNTSISTV